MKQQAPRYIQRNKLMPIHNDYLSLGEDLTLRRPVLIYTISRRDGLPIDTYRRTIEQAAPELTNPPCLHLLDMEVHMDRLHIILHYKPGQPLGAYMRSTRSTLAQKLSLILHFGRMWLEAEKELGAPLPSVSLDLHNIWLTEEGQLYAINSWDRPDANRSRSVAQSLSRLLVQLIVRVETPPATLDSVVTELRYALSANSASPIQADDLLAVLRHGWAGQLTLSAFVTSLLTIEGGGSYAADTRVLPPRSGRAVSSEVQPVKREGVNEAAAGKEAQKREQEHEQEEVLEDWHEDGQVDEQEDMQEDVQEEKPWFVRIGKRAAWSLSIAVVSLLVFTGVLTLLIQLIDLTPEGKSAAPSSTGPKGTSTASPSPTASASGSGSGSGSPSPTPAATPTPTPKPAGTPIPDIVSVPNLVGMTREAAEQKAKDSGLRYAFNLEPNDQPAGTVFKQDLPANQQVPKGERVTFWVSKGR